MDRKILKLFIISLLNTSLILNSADSSHCRLAGGWFEDKCKHVFVVDTFAYISTEEGYQESSFKILNIKDPLNPTVIGSLIIHSVVQDIYVQDSFAYLGVGQTTDIPALYIIDISDPSIPSFVSYREVTSYPDEVFVLDNLAYVVDRYDGILIFDVSDPASPFPVWNDDNPWDGDANDIYVLDTLAYVPYCGYGLYIYDVSHPSSPEVIEHFDENSGAVYIDDTLAYVTGKSDDQTVVYILNITNPTSVYEIGRYWGSLGRVHVKNNLGYGGAWENGLRILDVKRPKFPVEVGYYDPCTVYYDKVIDYAVYDTLGLFTTLVSGGLYIIDYLEKPPNIIIPHLIHDFDKIFVGDTISWSFKIYNFGLDTLEIDSIKNNLSVYSVSNSFPQKIPSYDSLEIELSFSPDTIKKFETALRIFNNDPFKKIKNLLLSGEGVVISISDTFHNFGAVAVADTSEWVFGIVNLGGDTLEIDSVTNKSSNYELYPDSPQNIPPHDTLYINVLFLPDTLEIYYDTISIYSSIPVECLKNVFLEGIGSGSIELSDYSHDFGHVVIGDSLDWDFRIFNIGDDTLEVDSIINNLSVYKIASPNFPQKIRADDTISVTVRYKPDTDASHVDTIFIFSSDTLERTVYIFLTGEGISSGIEEKRDSALIHITRINPNPFYENINIAYELSSTNNINIEIFNILGQEVRQLANERKAKGTHYITWDSKDNKGNKLQSGIYFFVIKAGKERFSKKIILLR